MEPNSQMITTVLNSILNKETVFFGLFLVGYYMQYKDKLDLKDTTRKQQEFMEAQQDVLKDITREVGNIAKAQERDSVRLERIESKIYQ
ncbi:hypothetical protein COE80_19470 [Bacillus pseudomycoides]|uniref:hypothetical protein n=1 Tax=Bacillus pseudomycoides TaxID=64104 RepID=UPI000BFC807E|nr:hypothetical protein [Bacillus pseudomycoides]PHB23094.1 hypothetical protein COE80_19470 [Bacillus pseudomycoides]PHE37623.1 hypothetical protein COF51_16435 [Bacillus pseudomycoides]